MKTEEIFIGKCECGSEIMEVEHWKEEKEFCFIQFKYMPIIHNFKRRLRFLFTGRVQFNEIILDYGNARRLAENILVEINDNI